MKLRPAGDRIVVRRLNEGERKSIGGIVLPHSGGDGPAMGRVISVGPGTMIESGERVVPDFEVGDQVMIPAYVGTEFTMGGEPLLLIRQDEVMGVVEN